MKVFIILVSLFLFSCSTQPKPGQWKYLFDGTSLQGWRAYNGTELPPHWVIKDGCLTFDTKMRLEADKSGGKDIIYSDEEFKNFELYLEWKLPKGGNSGVFYHLKEGYPAPYEVAPEYQILDDEGWEEINGQKLTEWQKAGADYAMHVPNIKTKVLNPAGLWNTTTIKFTSKRVEHYLNGLLILSFEPWTEDWYDKKEKSKWKDTPDYGKYKKGYIGLQDHDSSLWFRNIKIRKL